MCTEMRGRQFIANNSEVAEAWELEKEKLLILPTMWVEGEMRSEERGDGSNLSHPSTIKCECNMARNGLLKPGASQESWQDECRFSVDPVKLQPQFCVYEEECVFLEWKSRGFILHPPPTPRKGIRE